jgi:hypothetical protein
MKIPTKNSRGHTVLTLLCQGPVTFHQGVERHGELGATLTTLRRVYDQLVLDDCATFDGLSYAITIKAKDRILPPDRGDVQLGREPAPARTRPSVYGSTLNARSARRNGAAYGFSGARL